jgi:hypothetical protein
MSTMIPNLDPGAKSVSPLDFSKSAERFQRRGFRTRRLGNYLHPEETGGIRSNIAERDENVAAVIERKDIMLCEQTARDRLLGM